MNTPKQLYARFPYMFAGKDLGITLYKGWFLLFAKLCQDIDDVLGADKRNFHWAQVKEKFGAARWYFSMQNMHATVAVNEIGSDGVVTSLYRTLVRDVESISSHVSRLVHAAETLTHATCIVCGEPGKLDSHGGYILVLCVKHARQRIGGGSLPQYLFDEADQV
ncbi:MAG: hypothetical protein PHQ58_18910 [Rhodoferax sp.]|uniref:hypothetical protein n=1 Tax=Rhodoferax sp. TaxID=50421 RepID=UPI002628168F|nr:hypothetical protein [Rhodoferax sp.]MDD2882496.1 hypothetical protein [Rhodoferax sp.]